MAQISQVRPEQAFFTRRECPVGFSRPSLVQNYGQAKPATSRSGASGEGVPGSPPSRPANRELGARFVTDATCPATPQDPTEVTEKLVADLGDALQLRQRDWAGLRSATSRRLTPEQELAWWTFWFAIDHPPRPLRLRAWPCRLIRKGA
jgi:hypothetical protein